MQDPGAVTIVGAGNIGSFAAELVARSGNVRRMTLVDFDKYELKNLRSQNITSAEVGKPKVQALASKLRRINSSVIVQPICLRVEGVPLGVLRETSVILACLDSRSARRYVNQAAWRLGIPLIDAAVDGSGLLARVAVFVPTQDGACLECAWSDSDYEAEALEQPYPCTGNAGNDRLNRTSATNAPAALGAAAASLIAVEWDKLATGRFEHTLVGKQVMLDLRHHSHDITRFEKPNPECRFDHRMWDIQKLDDSPSALTLSQVFRLSDREQSELRLEGHQFARELYCPDCGSQARVGLHLVRRRLASRWACPHCGHSLVARGFDMIESLRSDLLASEERQLRLSSIGFHAADVFCLHGANGEVECFELGGMFRQKTGTGTVGV